MERVVHDYWIAFALYPARRSDWDRNGLFGNPDSRLSFGPVRVNFHRLGNL